MAARFTELIVDAADPPGLARWWADVLAWQVTEEDTGGVEIRDPSGARPAIVFVPVDQPKTGKNRLHIDLSPVSSGPGPTQGEAQDAELERLLSLGAVRVDVGQGSDVTWVVLADPEGNELCLLRSPVEAAPGSEDAR